MSLIDNKAGSGAVDPFDHNALVDAVVALQAASGGSQPLTVNRVPFAFDTPDLPVTGIPIYPPAVGDTLLTLLSFVSITENWDDNSGGGSSANLHVTPQGAGSDLGSGDLSASQGVDGDNASLGNLDAYAFSLLHTGAAMFWLSVLGSPYASWKFTSTAPLMMWVDNNLGADPESTTGAGEIVLVVLPAP